MVYGLEECSVSNQAIQFYEQSDTFSQLVVTESAATCILENFAKSPIGKVILMPDNVADFFDGRNDIKLNTSYLKKFFPIFYDRLGPDEDLTFRMEMKKPKVYFKSGDVDVAVEYILSLEVYHPNPKHQTGTLGMTNPFLLGDDIKIVTSFNLKTSNDVLYPTIVEHRVDINERYGQRTQPMINNIKMSENEYKEFIMAFEFTLNYLKKWMNDVHLRNGLKFPYGMEEFDSETQFTPGLMHIMLEVEEEAEEFLEDKYWH